MAFPIEFSIVVTYSLSALVFVHSVKFRGWYKTLIFLFGAIIVSGAGENVNIIMGGYYYPGSVLMIYYYRAPLDVCFGWFVILYCCEFFSHALIGNFNWSLASIGVGSEPEHGVDKMFLKTAIIRAAFAGLVGVNFDMFMDPVSVYNEWWIWKWYSMYFMGIPIFNYIGWFFNFFNYLLVYEIVITHFSAKKVKNLKTSVFWIVGCVIALLCSGIFFVLVIIGFGAEGVRTGGTIPLELNISSAIIAEGMLLGVFTLIVVGLILISSFAPNRSDPPKTLAWKHLPSIIMLLFWGSLVLIAALSDPFLIVIGFTHDLLFLGVSVYSALKKFDI